MPIRPLTKAKSAEHAPSSPEALLPLEAAHFLGITQELLFSYARTSPRKNQQNKTILRHVVRNGEIAFVRDELERFDSYLKEPWSKVSDDRPKIPAAIETFLRIEGGGQCARCGKGHKVTSAHIIPYAETRSHHHHNLIRLCTGCHSEYDDGLIARAEIEQIKERLIARTRERLLASMKSNQTNRGRVPNPAAVFVGRGEDVLLLGTMLRDKRSVSVEGTPGIGKTQLLIHALNGVSDQISTVWIDVEACANVSDLELALCIALSTPDRPVSSAALLTHLDQMDVRIVFDGVEKMSPADTDELHDFFQKVLTSTSRPRFVFSSQLELIGLNLDAHFRVQPIGEPAAIEVLSSALRTDGSNILSPDTDLNWLNSFCDGHALSLHLTAGLLRYFKSSAVVAKRIKASGSSELQTPGRRRPTSGTSLRTCLLVSYEILSTDQQRVLFLASLCPAGCFVPMLEEFFSIPDVDAHIAELRRWHLLDSSDECDADRLRVLSPIRSFVVQEWERQRQTEAEELRIRLVETLTIQANVLNFHHMQAGNTAYAVFRFDQEFPNFLNALRMAVSRSNRDKSFLKLVPTLSAALMVYCFVRGLIERGYAIMRKGADAALQMGEPERASNLLVQAFALARRSCIPQLATAVGEELSKLGAGSQNYEIQANAKFAEGHLALEERRWDEALSHLNVATFHYERLLEEADPADRASTQHNLTMVLWGKAMVY